MPLGDRDIRRDSFQAHAELCARKTRIPSEDDVCVETLPEGKPSFGALSSKEQRNGRKKINKLDINYSRTASVHFSFAPRFTFSKRISLRAIFLIAGSSSDSTNRFTATRFPVSRSLHLYTIPYDPSPSRDNFSYRSIRVLPRDLKCCKQKVNQEI